MPRGRGTLPDPDRGLALAILTGGLGGMGGAQPLAAVMAGAHCIAVEVQDSRIERTLVTSVRVRNDKLSGNCSL